MCFLYGLRTVWSSRITSVARSRSGSTWRLSGVGGHAYASDPRFCSCRRRRPSWARGRILGTTGLDGAARNLDSRGMPSASTSATRRVGTRTGGGLGRVITRVRSPPPGRTLRLFGVGRARRGCPCPWARRMARLRFNAYGCGGCGVRSRPSVTTRFSPSDSLFCPSGFRFFLLFSPRRPSPRRRLTVAFSAPIWHLEAVAGPVWCGGAGPAATPVRNSSDRTHSGCNGVGYSAAIIRAASRGLPGLRATLAVRSRVSIAISRLCGVCGAKATYRAAISPGAIAGSTPTHGRGASATSVARTASVFSAFLCAGVCLMTRLGDPEDVLLCGLESPVRRVA